MPSRTIDIIFDLVSRWHHPKSILMRLSDKQLNYLATLFRSGKTQYGIQDAFKRRFGLSLPIALFSSLRRPGNEVKGPSLFGLDPGAILLGIDLTITKTGRIRCRFKSPLKFSVKSMGVRAPIKLPTKSAPKRQDLNPADQQRLAALEPLMGTILNSDRVFAGCINAARSYPKISPTSFYRIFSAYEKSGRDWRVLVDRRNYSALWRRTKQS